MSRRTSSLTRDVSRGRSSPARQPSHPRSPRQNWKDSLRTKVGNASPQRVGPSSPDPRATSPRGGAVTPDLAVSARRPATPASAAAPASVSTAARSMTPHQTRGSGMSSGSRMTPSRVGTSRATQPTKASAAKALDRGSGDRFSSDRNSSSTGWSSPRRAGPPAVAVGRSSPPTSFGIPGNGVADVAPSARSRSPDVPEIWDVPFDSERLAQLASASPVSRRRLTMLLQEVQSEIGRIFGNDRANLAPTPEVANVSRTTDVKLASNGAAYERGSPLAGTAASGSTSVPSTASTSAAGTASTEISHAAGPSQAHSSFEADGPAAAIVQRLCHRVSHLQAVWEAGLEAASGDPHHCEVTGDVPPRRRYEGASDSVAGLARLEDIVERLENQVSMNFPVLRSATPEGMAVRKLEQGCRELQQQKLALQAEVLSLMQQKQEIKAGTNTAGPPIGISPRRSASSSERHGVLSPEHLRKASSPGRASLSRDHGTASAGDFDADSEVTCDLASGIAPSPPTASPGQVIAGGVTSPHRLGWMDEEGGNGSRSTYVLTGSGAAVAAASGVAANAAAAMTTAAGSLSVPAGSLQPHRGGSVAVPPVSPVPPVVGLSTLRAVPANGAQARMHAGGVQTFGQNARVAQSTAVQACVLPVTHMNTPPSSPRPYASSMQPLVSSYTALSRSPLRPRS